MDMVMPDVDGVEAIRRIVAESPRARIIALTLYHQEQYMLRAVPAGARGPGAGRAPGLPEPLLPQPLTASEMVILRLVAQGVENKDIAQELSFSVYTVSSRLRTIYKKLHVINRTKAALHALRHGWAVLDEPPQ